MSRRFLGALLCVAALTAVFPLRPASAEPGDEPAAVAYVPPADAPVADPFRPPPTPFAAGNRGIDLATTRGDAVRASAAGEVVFAGPVGGRSHVVVLHADGIRTDGCISPVPYRHVGASEPRVERRSRWRPKA